MHMRRQLPYSNTARGDAAEANAWLCPACRNPMQHARTVWRGLHVDCLEIYECKPCGVSLSQAPYPTARAG
jgi:hypothetical protein